MKDTPVPGPREFRTTHWSLVGDAQSDEASRTRAREAVEELCRAYWYPLYAFVRSRGHAPADAQDLTQAFFAQFIATSGFASADRERGRLRTYLLGAMKHFLANEWHRARRQKRGGGVTFLAWDALEPETRYALEPRHAPDADSEFDREWALELTTRCMEKLRAESEASGKGEIFTVLKGSLSGDESARRETAAQLGMSEGAVKVAVYRLRQRYRELLRAEIAQTLTEQADLEEEMRHLIAALRKH